MSKNQKLSVITGAFSYTGRYITEILQKKGEKVRNLTNHPGRPFPKDQINKREIDTYELAVDDVNALSKSMEGADTLYCTYWVRFNDHKGTTREQGIQRAQNIIQAAKNANIKKIIYTSHTQASLDSPFAYTKGKATMEQYIRESGISYGFAKPCMIFGNTANESIVINNLAYVLKRIPMFTIPGNGLYPVQPVHVQDMAELCVNMAQDYKNNQEQDAVGPEIFTFEEFVRKVQSTVNSRNLILKGVSNEVAHSLTLPLDYILKDKFIEKEDLDLLTNNYLYSKFPPTGKRSLSEWLQANQNDLGKRYINSTNLYYDKSSSFIFDDVKKPAAN